MRTSVLERFLRYVAIDTTADERNPESPSTPGQWTLLRLLEGELRTMGAHDVHLSPQGHLTGTIPAAGTGAGVPAIGLIAHVDTSPEMSGASVRPIVHESYGGGTLAFPDAADLLLRPEESRALHGQVGHDIVTASGTTLLGADDKAGVAEIMAAAEYLLAHQEISRGPVRVAFTPDEEIGRGADRFDVERFGAFCAYTLDGGEVGELQSESFSADSMVATFHGFNTHPGYAKDRMVNAIRMAAAFVEMLPAHALTPERSEGHDGYVHAHGLDAAVDRAVVRLLVRDFDTQALAGKERTAEGLAREAASRYGGRVEIEVKEQYRNMREVLDRHPEVVERAAEAIARAGLTVRSRPIRGGTDGSRLSFMGLPTPNLFAGQHNIHSRLEWTSRQDMEAAVRTIIELCRVWAESGATSRSTTPARRSERSVGS